MKVKIQVTEIQEKIKHMLVHILFLVIMMVAGFLQLKDTTQLMKTEIPILLLQHTKIS